MDNKRKEEFMRSSSCLAPQHYTLKGFVALELLYICVCNDIIFLYNIFQSRK